MQASGDYIVFRDVILVPTDFSELCSKAVDYAAQMAKNLKYKLEILHIIDNHTRKYLEDHMLKEVVIYNKLKEMSAEISEQYDIDVNFIVREGGGVYKQIGQIAGEIEAKLLVLGTHGKSGFQKITGSHAMKVVEHSPAPVIVVQNKKFELTKGGFNNIMLPVSLYAQVRQKASWAALMAKAFDAKVHIFQYFEEDRGQEYSQDVVTRQITDFLKKREVSYEIKVAQQDVKYGEQVVRYADFVNADLIMIMVTQERFFNLEYGDYDERLMYNRFKIPVMFINPRFYDRIKLFAAWNER